MANALESFRAELSDEHQRSFGQSLETPVQTGAERSLGQSFETLLLTIYPYECHRSLGQSLKKPGQVGAERSLGQALETLVNAVYLYEYHRKLGPSFATLACHDQAVPGRSYCCEADDTRAIGSYSSSSAADDSGNIKRGSGHMRASFLAVPPYIKSALQEQTTFVSAVSLASGSSLDTSWFSGESLTGEHTTDTGQAAHPHIKLLFGPGCPCTCLGIENFTATPLPRCSRQIVFFSMRIEEVDSIRQQSLHASSSTTALCLPHFKSWLIAEPQI